MSSPDLRPDLRVLDRATPEPVAAWLPPALTREYAPALPSGGGWMLPDLGGPAPAAEPVDASFEAGYAAGLRDGVAQAGAQLKPASQVLQGVARDLAGKVSVLVSDRQRDLEALALAVARQLVQREVTADPALVATWITRAIALLPHDLTIEIRVHPAELEAMAPVRDTLLPKDSGVTLHWIADAEVGRAGFVVESPQRLVDGRLDVALRALYERLEQE